MNTSTLSRKATGIALIVICLLSTLLAVLHTDLDLIYSPNCPACQLQSNPGSHVSAISTATLVPEQVVVSLLPDHHEVVVQQFDHTLELITRSPPANA